MGGKVGRGCPCSSRDVAQGVGGEGAWQRCRVSGALLVDATWRKRGSAVVLSLETVDFVLEELLAQNNVTVTILLCVTMTGTNFNDN